MPETKSEKAIPNDTKELDIVQLKKNLINSKWIIYQKSIN